ncbi:PhzF family phenazine biosynthesis protein [Sneathiella sp. CAU 1612]|uniref:PhzF family phenazine biosynthesis protein n=1 Tax=Sneathiella sedimenti TaxID=2816034 RepID=A0ABS3F3S1_9PROT|nr:PhzF family phenazine biosynthesis protein [Sneathiella sedimenti]MBO0333172.1 PhzF family phenazine biosynthesis protein [Sneathiella sedimenti]
MNVLKIAAFSDGAKGGNPAGVALSDTLPAPEKMQESAAEVGFSETAFAALEKDQKTWRVRYFSPESEVPFCGHATIALGAALAEKFGPGKYMLRLNDAEISVEGEKLEGRYAAALQSPPTRSDPLGQSEIEATLALFGYSHDQLDDSIPPARIHGGADHYVFALKNRDDLRSMNYDLDSGRQFMRSRDLITIMLLWREDETTFHVRNAFASGGVLEDPATGAAAAAFSGYLRDIAWPHGGKINIIQGEDMGARSLITAEIGDEAGSSIRVSGMTRKMDD